jgi:hypothetical protein
MQLAWAEEVARQTHKPVLILAPLAVASQTTREGAKFGVQVSIAKTQDDVRKNVSGIYLTNYDKLGHFDMSQFSGVALDESSILKSFMGKTKQQLVEVCKQVPYRSCWTATPAPNDYMELGNHAEFLGVMPANEMLMRWFINDTTQAGAYRLKSHAEKSFWEWVASWAVSCSKPSDLGFSDEGYNLPELKIIPQFVEFDQSEKAFATGILFTDTKLSATSIHKTLRESANLRAARAAELVATDQETP